MKKILVIMVLLLSLSANAYVFDNEKKLSYIQNKLPEIKNVNCKFKQDKYIKKSNLHIKSSGNFKFEKDKGVTFYTTYPIQSTVNYTNKDYKQINNIIKAISNKNYTKLESDFKFYFEEDNKLWHFGLKPKQNSKCYNYISSIEISGKKEISKIIITTNEVKTTIDFEF